MSTGGRRGWVWFHRASAFAWGLALVPALLWWRESVLFVIIASVYANVKSDWGAAEAADNREILDRLDRIEQAQLDSLQRNEYPE